MKKIRITETQAKRIGIINENVTPLLQYETYCQKLSQQVNEIYGKVINLSIDEIVSNEISMEEVNNKLNAIESGLMKAHKNMEAYINGSEEMETKIDEIYDTVSIKLTSLSLITMDLEKIQRENEGREHSSLKKIFSDIKPISL